MIPTQIINTAADRPSQNAIISSPISGDVFNVDSYRCDKVGCLTVSFISYDNSGREYRLRVAGSVVPIPEIGLATIGLTMLYLYCDT